MVDVTMATSFPLPWWKDVKVVMACLLWEGKWKPPLPIHCFLGQDSLCFVWTEQTYIGEWGVHGHPFSSFLCGKGFRANGGGGCGGDNGFIQAEIGILPVL